MKRILFFLSLLTFALMFGCAKDNIVLIDPIAADDEGDYIENTTFDRTVYISFSNTEDAQVTGLTSANDSISVSVRGNDVTITNIGSEYVQYELSGSCSDGFFKIYSTAKQAIILDGLTLTNPNGAAINVQNKRTFIVVKGDNSLSDGSSYTDTPDEEDEKAALFSEDQIIFSGDGTLTVNAQGKAGVTSDDYVRVMGSPTLVIRSTAGHGLRGKDDVIINGGSIDIEVTANMKKGISSDGSVCITGGDITINVTGGTAYDDDDEDYTGTAGVKADGKFLMEGGSLSITNSGTGGKGISGDANGYFNGGSVNITCSGSNYGSSGGGWGNSSSSSSVSAKGIKFDGNLVFAGSDVVVSCHAHEGIEAKGTITVSAGTVYSYSAADDAINAGGDFTISGGKVYGYAPNNDGLDANGDFYVNGGLVYAIGSSSPEVAIDANTEGGHQLYVNGGTLIAIGGLESGSSLSQSCYQASSWSKNTWYALTVGSATYAFKTPSSGGTPLVVSGASTPTLSSGVTVSSGTSLFEGLFYNEASVTGGSSVSLSSYSGGNGGGPGGGGGPF
ncbi:MAG: carbohydrate-binding domain-containing protein [Bacteroidales bacterium]|nr:carbohydrate-binding domain-containing protein [Bacteroidales bacterium]